MAVEKFFATSGEAFVETGVDLLVQHIKGAIEQHGRCIIGLSGGSTPKPIYEGLREKQEIDWSAVHIFLIDDRCVPADHADSNQKLVHDTLLANANIPASNIVFPDTSLPLIECAADYTKRLTVLLSKGFDISVLGMGPDAHIASLFPPLSSAMQSEGPVITTQTPLTPEGKPLFAVRDRITVTLPVLQQAQWTLMLLGKGKHVTWDAMMQSDEDAMRWPAKALLDKDFTLLMQRDA